MSRKLLSVLLAVALVLTTMSVAFAAAIPSDVTSDYVKSVSKLQALNIMAGYPDGTFKPDQTITRAEFAKIAVVAMGLKDAAAISAGTTSFKDVAADNWASGFINVASAQGIITGYPDGTFKPDQTINYAEALTILAKMLGYGPVLAGKPWPAAYVGKAADIGITSGVVLAPTVGASRGNVAKLMSNTLDTKMVYVSSYDDQGKPTYAVGPDDNYLLMAKKLSVSKVAGGDNLFVTKTPTVIDSPTVDKSTLIDVDATPNTTQTLKFAASLNANDYLGLKIKAWKNSDGDICVAEIENGASDVYQGAIQKDGDNLKLIGTSTSYPIKTGDFTGYLNSTSATFVQIRDAAQDPIVANAKVVLENGQVKFVNAYIADTQTSGTAPGYTSFTFVVKDIKDGYLRSIKSVYADKKIQDIKDDITKQVTRYDFIKNGTACTIDDIAAGDVVTIAAASKYQKWIITSAADITGTLTAVKGSGNASSTFTIGGTDYKFGHDYVTSWDNTSNYTYKGFAGAVSDAFNKSITIKLNDAGQIASFVTSASATTYYYGIYVTSSVNSGLNQDSVISIYKADGTKVAYTFEKAANISGTPTQPSYVNDAGAGWVWGNASINGATIKTGDLIEYQLTSDGKIKDGTLVKYSSLKDTADYAAATDLTTTPTDATAGSRINNKIVAGDTVIFDVYNVVYNGDPVKLLTFSAINGKAHNYQEVLSGNVIKYVAVNGGEARGTGAVNSNDLAASTNGVIADYGTNGDGDYVVVNENGTLKTYGLAGSLTLANVVKDMGGNGTAAEKGYYLDYNVNSAGKISAIKAGYANGGSPYGVNSSFTRDRRSTFRVDSVDTVNSVIKVDSVLANGMNGGNTYYFTYKASDLQVYNCFDKANPVGGKAISDISVDDYVWLNVGVGDINNTNVTRIIKVKRDDITD